MHKAKKIAVVGGGITGLAAAYRLSVQGHSVRLFERSGRVGGVIRSEEQDGWLIESGPNSLQEKSPEIAALWRELGLEAERVEANPDARKRYLVRRGRLLPVPMSPPALVSSSLFSFGAKIRMLSEMFARRRQRADDVSLGTFGREHFGSELVEYGLQPLVSGVYAGNVDRLSVRHAFPTLLELERQHGSILRGQIASARERRAKGLRAVSPIISFRRGLQTLSDAVAGRLPAGTIRLGVQVSKLTRGQAWEVHWQNQGAAESEAFDAIAIALPGLSVAGLAIGNAGQRPLSPLAAIEYPPVSALFLGFRREQVRHPLDGFGALVPAIEKRRILGVLFSSTLFPHRAPPGHVALTVMIGGALQPALANHPADELWSLVRDDVVALLGVSGEPVLKKSTFWPQAIPQYNLNYQSYLDSIRACEAEHPGLYFGGSVCDGISVPDCLASGFRLAARAADSV